MARPIQEPTVSEEKWSGDTQQVLRHPAFGQVVVSKVTGQRHLYGSDFTHHQYVTVTLYESETHRSLARDWPFAKKAICSFAMSEAQWAAFVSSFNNGSGTQCTIEDRIMDDGKYHMMPDFPLRDTRLEYKKESVETLDDTLKTINEAINDIENITAGLSKAKQAAVKECLLKVRQELRSNIPFIMNSLSEHVENTIEHSKVEVEAYINNTIMRRGLAELQKGAQILEIESEVKSKT